MEKMGYPYELTKRRWESILKKILWSLENYDDLEIYDKWNKKQWEKKEKEVKEKFKSDKFNLEMNLCLLSVGKYNKEKTEKNYKKFQEGWDLFHKYFFSLWD